MGANFISGSKYAFRENLGAKPTAMSQPPLDVFAGELAEVTAGLTQTQTSQCDFADAEVAADQVIEGNSARE